MLRVLWTHSTAWTLAMMHALAEPLLWKPYGLAQASRVHACMLLAAHRAPLSLELKGRGGTLLKVTKQHMLF